ncbi:acyltransferase family protein [Pseudonocardia sp. HH130629-09]|uniref:acyltransferase family protein n=1 Tax=Pseudonocardia sp. HH130629-09 TaxID=1641402 RepID=UPI0006CB5FF4|nr:acyltransferase family protein [Pseudonocardia sp. HH130629-09]ALE82194.1 hypothetical protein XF36_02790 [Pseudonocardia sp. HH130629-09]
MIAAPSRVPALDGPRGVASLVVVVNHCLMTDPTLAAVAAGTGRAAPGTLAWWLAYTPLHLVWAGTEAVLLFFVLSGFVLTGSATRDGFGWGSYYAQRLPRLYRARALQIVGALLLVVAALCRPPVLRVLERPWVQWLGSRSFSLYLTHDAVVISTVLLFGGRPPVWLTMLDAVPVALVVAEVFFRGAERPAHRLARRIGRRVEGAAQVRPVA